MGLRVILRFAFIDRGRVRVLLNWRQRGCRAGWTTSTHQETSKRIQREAKRKYTMRGYRRNKSQSKRVGFLASWRVSRDPFYPKFNWVNSPGTWLEQYKRSVHFVNTHAEINPKNGVVVPRWENTDTELIDEVTPNVYHFVTTLPSLSLSPPSRAVTTNERSTNATYGQVYAIEKKDTHARSKYFFSLPPRPSRRSLQLAPHPQVGVPNDSLTMGPGVNTHSVSHNTKTNLV